jgi:hypothetical protein
MAEETGTLHIPAPTATAPTFGQPQGFLSPLAVEALITEANQGKTLAEQVAYWWNWQRIAGTALRALQMQEDYSRAVRFITRTPADADRPVTEISPALAEQRAFTLNNVAA